MLSKLRCVRRVRDVSFFVFVFVYKVLVGINQPGLGFDELLVALQNGVSGEHRGARLQKQAIANVAR